jgi:hypothetical protein
MSKTINTKAIVVGIIVLATGAYLLSVVGFANPIFQNAFAKGGSANQKAEICHVPPGNPANAHTITISENAVRAHLAHGDYRGACVKMCTLTVVSDGTELLGSGGMAVPTWQHPVWVSPTIEPVFTGAQWIWSTPTVTDPRSGETVNFTKRFKWEGGAVASAMLYVASDNSNEISLGSFTASNPGEDNFQPGNWDSYDVKSNIVAGNNTLEIDVWNWPWPTDDPQANPAGLLYRLVITSAEPRCAT